MTATAALAADLIPNLDPRYRQHLKPPTPKKAPSLKAHFKTTMWWSAAEYVQLMSMSAELRSGKMSLYAFLREHLQLEDAKEKVSRASQLAAIRGMAKPPRDEIGARRKLKLKRRRAK
jgi:hypothetical protein